MADIEELQNKITDLEDRLEDFEKIEKDLNDLLENHEHKGIDTKDVISENRPKMKAYLSSAQNISNATDTDVEFDKTEFDYKSMYDASTYKATPIEDGYYLIIASVSMQGLDDQTIYTLTILKDATTIAFTKATGSGSSSSLSLSISTIQKLTKSEEVKVVIREDGTAGGTVIAEGAYRTYFIMYKLK